MVRKQGTSPKLKIFIIISSLAISIILATALIWFLILKQKNNKSEFDTKIDEISSNFIEAEDEYSTILEEILQREYLPDIKLILLERNYQSIYDDVKKYNPGGELELITVERITNIQELQRINSILRTENTTADYLSSYNTCKNSIKYSPTRAGAVYTQLLACSEMIEDAKTEINKITSYLFSSTCNDNYMPEYIISKISDSHYMLLDYYDLLRKRKGPAAAEVDRMYQLEIESIESLPKWNYCITVYLEEKFETIKN